MPAATPPVSPEPGSRSSARGERRSRGGSGRGSLGGRDLGARGRRTEKLRGSRPAGRSAQVTTLRRRRAAPRGSGGSASSRGAASCSRLSGVSTAPRGPHTRSASRRRRQRGRQRRRGGGCASGGPRGSAPGAAPPPRPSPPARRRVRARVRGPAGPLLVCAQRPPASRPRAAPWRPGSLALPPARPPGSRHVSVSEVEIQRKTRFIPSPTAILYFMPNLIFIPTFYSRSVSTFSVAFLSYSFFFFVLFLCFFFFFFFHFFDYCLYLGTLEEMVSSLFLSPSFSSRRWFRGRGRSRSGRPCCGATPARCATGFMEKAV